jgi:hypothetical protein
VNHARAGTGTEKLANCDPALFAHVLPQLDVKGCPNIYESFKKYTETEMLTGPNQYEAEGYGLQVGQMVDQSSRHAFRTAPCVHVAQTFEEAMQVHTVIQPKGERHWLTLLILLPLWLHSNSDLIIVVVCFV